MIYMVITLIVVGGHINFFFSLKMGSIYICIYNIWQTQILAYVCIWQWYSQTWAILAIKEALNVGKRVYKAEVGNIFYIYILYTHKKKDRANLVGI